MSRQKIHTATEADWSFYADEMTVQTLSDAAQLLADKYKLEVEDCEQDALLWLSVRPEVADKHISTGNYEQLRWDAYSGLSKAYAVTHRDSHRLVSYEEEFNLE